MDFLAANVGTLLGPLGLTVGESNPLANWPGRVSPESQLASQLAGWLACSDIAAPVWCGNCRFSLGAPKDRSLCAGRVFVFARATPANAT